jgi:light-independent protochlorophyllide reductase subunit B
MFREDFEFNDAAGASHLGHARHAAGDRAPVVAADADGTTPADHTRIAVPPAGHPAEQANEAEAVWSRDAELELRKIPFFVRGKARRNTERFARERGIREIALETLYDAKAHFAR